MQTERIPHPRMRLASTEPTRPATDPAARQRAARLVQSVATTIEGILSHDSERFLADNRQTGGQ